MFMLKRSLSLKNFLVIANNMNHKKSTFLVIADSMYHKKATRLFSAWLNDYTEEKFTVMSALLVIADNMNHKKQQDSFQHGSMIILK